MKKQMINRKEGVRNCAGDRKLYFTTLNSILTHVPKRLENMKEMLVIENYDQFIIEAHTLKSNAALIGADSIQREAKELEYAGKEKDLNRIHKYTDAFISGYYELLEEVKSMIEEKEFDQFRNANFSSEQEQMECKAIVKEAYELVGEQRINEAMDVLAILTIYEIPEQFEKQIQEAKSVLRGKEQKKGIQILQQLVMEV